MECFSSGSTKNIPAGVKSFILPARLHFHWLVLPVVVQSHRVSLKKPVRRASSFVILSSVSFTSSSSFDGKPFVAALRFPTIMPFPTQSEGVLSKAFQFIFPVTCFCLKGLSSPAHDQHPACAHLALHPHPTAPTNPYRRLSQYKRTSFIVLSIGSVVALSAVMMGGHSLYNFMFPRENGEEGGGFCSVGE